MDPINPKNATNPKNPTNTDNKVVPIKPKTQIKRVNSINSKNTKTQKSQRIKKRASIPKQPHKKVTIRRDVTAKRKKKKEPISYKYFRKRTGSFWANYWEILVTIFIAVIFAIYILPRFLQ